MTPREHAIELVDQYNFIYIQNYTSIHEVKQCALIAVDEILRIFEDTNGSDYRFEYWEEVKQEIEKL